MVWFAAQKKRSQQLFIFHCVNSQGHYLDAIFLLHSQWYSDGKGCTEISFASLWFPWGGFWVYDSLKLLQLYEQKWCQALYNILKMFPAVLEIDCFAWKCPKTELFLVRIFLYSEWIRRKYRKIRTGNNSVFGLFSSIVVIKNL